MLPIINLFQNLQVNHFKGHNKGHNLLAYKVRLYPFYQAITPNRLFHTKLPFQDQEKQYIVYILYLLNYLFSCNKQLHQYQTDDLVVFMDFWTQPSIHFLYVYEIQ